jgi:hypothetical protein
LDPAVYAALASWGAAELRSTNAQIEFLLRRALAGAGRLPKHVGQIRRPGRPASSEITSSETVSVGGTEARAG